MKTVKITGYDPTVSQDDFESSKVLGSNIGAFSNVGELAADVIGAAALFSSFDPTGSMLKATMLVKIFRRLRYIHVKFGISLNAFLVALDPGFQQNKKEEDMNYFLQGKTSGKLTFDLVPVLYVWSANWWKPLVFILLWFAKSFIVPGLVRELKGHKRTGVRYPIPKGFSRKCKTVFFIRKFEFLFFQLNLVDGIFVCGRLMANFNFSRFAEYLDTQTSGIETVWLTLCFFITITIMYALCADIMEVFNISMRVWDLDFMN
jgi:hypothetical protein